jgi:hypothetical protein
LQDNELLDHEDPPPVPRLGWRDALSTIAIHYRAPTEPGNSDSPVFNEAPDWQMIGLDHAGGEYVRKLNGHPGTYAAKEPSGSSRSPKQWRTALLGDLIRAIIFFGIARRSLGGR